MTLDDLEKRLDAEAIDPGTYSLRGGSGWNGCYCLDVRDGRWICYFAERGEETAGRQFATEAEACDYFWDWISRDPMVHTAPSSI